MTKMAHRVRMVVLLATAVSFAAPPALAQRNGNYPVQEMNFDLWCQEQAGLPAERCDKRTAQDEAAFEDPTQTVMDAPHELVSAVREMIAKRETAGAKRR